MPIRLFVFTFLLIPALVFSQDYLIEERLSMMSSEAPLEYNQIVHSIALEFLENNENATGELIERFQRHETFIDSVFVNVGIPTELKYFPAALSNCLSTSSFQNDRAGWFKMPSDVARRHGLKVTRYVDERRDPEKAALAFAHELKELNKEYRNWKNSILVYLSSHDAFEKNRKRGVHNYSLYHDFYRYVALAYVIHYHDSCEITPSQIFPTEVVGVDVQQLTTLYQLASGLNVNYHLFKEMNAIFIREIIPSNIDVTVHIPKSKMYEFKSLGEKLYEYTSVPTYTATEIKFIGTSAPKKKVENEPAEADSIQEEITAVESVDIIYHVKDGDILFWIADYYDCTIEDLVFWNNLSSDWLDIDQPLIIRVASDKREYYSKIDGMTRKEKRALAALD